MSRSSCPWCSRGSSSSTPVDASGTWRSPTASNEGEVALYHLAVERYAPGRLVGPFPKNRLALSRDRDLMYPPFEEHLDRFRPAEACPRRAACFAFPSIEACWTLFRGRHGRGECPGGGIVYRVAMPSPVACPYAIPNEVYTRLRRGLAVAELAREYWRPTLAWGVLEYVDRCFKVLEVVAGEEPEDAAAFGAALQADTILARDLFA